MVNRRLKFVQAWIDHAMEQPGSISDDRASRVCRCPARHFQKSSSARTSRPWRVNARRSLAAVSFYLAR